MNEKNLIFFDDSSWNHLLPLTFTRPLSEIRIGILKIKEKWERYLNFSKSSNLTQPFLYFKYPLVRAEENILINGSILPNRVLVKQIAALQPGECIADNQILIAANITKSTLESFSIVSVLSQSKKLLVQSEYKKVNSTWDIFLKNRDELFADFKLLTEDKTCAVLSKTNTIIAPENIFIETGTYIEGAIINASGGPVYIGKGAEIMEGSMLRGPIAIGENATIKMGAKIYGDTTIGPFSKVGGEVSNSVIFGYTNKAHDGFLGNSVLGEWCNLGADTNNSNLKNNYSDVLVWDYAQKDYVDTKLQFCGLIMGDHSKSGINTMFNTGTVVGLCANIFGEGFPPKHIPSFSWGGADKMEIYQLEKAIDTATHVYKRRKMIFDETEENIFKYIFENYSIPLKNKPEKKK